MTTRSRIALVAACALGLGVACTNNGGAVCAKAKECCSKVSGVCDYTNRQGEGYEDRCAIDYNAYLDATGTYGKEACAKIGDAYADYISCLAGVECIDITDQGAVAKCDALARGYCQAKKDSGDDQCGGRYKDIRCDNAKASIGDMLL